MSLRHPVAPWILDDRSSNGMRANNDCMWHAVSDTVMGGISHAALTTAEMDGKACLHLTGQVSLENNGGFVQASIDLSPHGVLDAHHYRGITFEVYGNDEQYDVRLRTSDTRLSWQSYRAGFFAPSHWHTITLLFAQFAPHRLEVPLDITQLKRLGIVAIGRVMTADLYFRDIKLFS